MGNQQHKQTLRHDLHPCANRGDNQTYPQQTEVAITQGAKGLYFGLWRWRFFRIAGSWYDTAHGCFWPVYLVELCYSLVYDVCASLAAFILWETLPSCMWECVLDLPWILMYRSAGKMKVNSLLQFSA